MRSWSRCGRKGAGCGHADYPGLYDIFERQGSSASVRGGGGAACLRACRVVHSTVALACHERRKSQQSTTQTRAPFYLCLLC